MSCEPVDLAAPLAAVLLDVLLALGAVVTGNELLVELLALSVVVTRVVDAHLVLEPDLLQRTLFVSALARVDHLVTRWLRDGLGVHSAHVGHHDRVVEAS